MPSSKCWWTWWIALHHPVWGPAQFIMESDWSTTSSPNVPQSEIRVEKPAKNWQSQDLIWSGQQFLAGGVGWLVMSDSDGPWVWFLVSLEFQENPRSLKKPGESDRGNSFKRLTFFFCQTKKMVVSSSSMIFFGGGGGSKMEIWQHVPPPQ